MEHIADLEMAAAQAQEAGHRWEKEVIDINIWALRNIEERGWWQRCLICGKWVTGTHMDSPAHYYYVARTFYGDFGPQECPIKWHCP